MRLLLAVLILVSSVDFLYAADPVYPQGSTIGLVPPQGMTPAATFAGFQDEDGGASIILSTVPGIAFGELIAGLSDGSRLAQQGIIEDRRENSDSWWKSGATNRRSTAASLRSLVRKWMLIVGSPKRGGARHGSIYRRDSYHDTPMPSFAPR